MIYVCIINYIDLLTPAVRVRTQLPLAYLAVTEQPLDHSTLTTLSANCVLHTELGQC